LGLAVAAMLGWALFATTRRLNLARFFQVTNILLVLFSAGMVAQGIHEFNEAGIIPGLVDQVWNLGPILSDQSIPGAILKTLLGYTATPSLTQLVAYLAYLGILIWLLAGSPRPNLRKAQA
ncbi:MAG: FTR1 family protein, partial [Omnitrophica WOR_2 bacterium]